MSQLSGSEDLTSHWPPIVRRKKWTLVSIAETIATYALPKFRSISQSIRLHFRPLLSAMRVPPSPLPPSQFAAGTKGDGDVGPISPIQFFVTFLRFRAIDQTTFIAPVPLNLKSEPSITYLCKWIIHTKLCQHHYGISTTSARCCSIRCVYEAMDTPASVLYFDATLFVWHCRPSCQNYSSCISPTPPPLLPIFPHLLNCPFRKKYPLSDDMTTLLVALQ